MDGFKHGQSWSDSKTGPAAGEEETSPASPAGGVLLSSGVGGALRGRKRSASNDHACLWAGPPHTALQAYGALHVLVSNAAVNPTAGPLLDTPPEALDKLWDINLKAALALVQEARPHLKPGASIIFVASVAAYK